VPGNTTKRHVRNRHLGKALARDRKGHQALAGQVAKDYQKGGSKVGTVKWGKTSPISLGDDGRVSQNEGGNTIAGLRKEQNMGVNKTKKNPETI